MKKLWLHLHALSPLAQGCLIKCCCPLDSAFLSSADHIQGFLNSKLSSPRNNYADDTQGQQSVQSLLANSGKLLALAE